MGEDMDLTERAPGRSSLGGLLPPVTASSFLLRIDAYEASGSIERFTHDDAHGGGAERPLFPCGDIADRVDESIDGRLRLVLEPRDEQERTQQRQEDRSDHREPENPRGEDGRDHDAERGTERVDEAPGGS